MDSSAVVMANVKPLMGKPKGMVEINGRPMIEYVLDAIPPEVSDIMIAVNEESVDDYGEVYDKYMARPLPTSADNTDVAQQLRKPLHDAQGGNLLVLPCDAPLMSLSITTFLLEVSRKFTAAIPRLAGQPEFIPASYQVKPLIETMEAHPELGMYELVKKMRNILYINAQSLRAFDSKLRFMQRVNSKGDIKRVSEVLRTTSESMD